MKVYLSGGPMDGKMREVAEGATSFRHHRFVGRTQDAYYEAVQRLHEGNPADTETITLHADDLVTFVYRPVGEAAYAPHAVVKGESYPIWEVQS